MASLDDPRTPGRLRLLGVRHVVVDERPSGRADVLPPPRPAHGLNFLNRIEGRALYEVTAPPACSLVLGGSGFFPPGGEPEWQFANRGDPRLLVAANCASCAGTLRFVASSLARDRTLVVRDTHGARLAQARLPRDEQVEVTVPPSF